VFVLIYLIISFHYESVPSTRNFNNRKTIVKPNIDHKPYKLTNNWIMSATSERVNSGAVNSRPSDPTCNNARMRYTKILRQQNIQLPSDQPCRCAPMSSRDVQALTEEYVWLFDGCLRPHRCTCLKIVVTASRKKRFLTCSESIVLSTLLVQCD
jgi:hypothetical protein